MDTLNGAGPRLFWHHEFSVTNCHQYFSPITLCPPYSHYTQSVALAY